MLKAKNLLKIFNIDKDNKIIVAVSGGIDSMVLLSFLKNQEYEPIVVHFNHNTRDTNKRDESLIKSYCENHNIKYHIISIKVTKGNFQSEARDLRYQNLKLIADKYNTSYIATAHHLDDLAETVLIKITRGSNLYGYAGIHPIFSENGYTFIRPLLHISKLEIKKYQEFNEIPYFDDESNLEDTYLRNRYRHTVIPILKQENEQFLNKVLTYHHQLGDAYSFIKKEANKYIVNNNVDLNIYKTLDLVLQNEVIAILLSKYNLDTSYDTVTKIRTMLLNDTTNNTYDLKDNYKFIKTYNNIYIIKEEKSLDFTVLLDEKELFLPIVGKITFLDSNVKSDDNINEICYNILTLPLIARTRKQGDILTFPYGRKKLKDHLIDLKIPPHERERLWMITDNDDNILWISNNVYVNKTMGSNNVIKFIIGE